ncbi:MAG: methyltransferase domain-containing protein [Chloroflexota bacterium]|nr:methyltransferase domain-containing protein [Chloroflexota bacterium]
MIRTYFNGKAATWDEVAAEKDQSKLRQMAARLDIRPGSVVLDVGTGTGIFLPFLLQRIGGDGKILALDIAEEMLCRARAKNFDGVVAYLNADVAHIPLPEALVDSVVCYSSFPHFQDKSRALAEMYRVMKGGSRLYICHTSCRAAINGLHNGIPEVAHDVIPEDWEMRLMLSEAGFTDIEVEDNCENYLCQALRRG